MSFFDRPFSEINFEQLSENELKFLFLNYFGSQKVLNTKDIHDINKIDLVYNQQLDYFYNQLEKAADKTKTSQHLLVNLLSYQKQLENPRYDFKGLEFEVFNEDVQNNDFKSVSYQLSKAHYVDKLSMFFQSTNITDEQIKYLSLIYIFNKSLKNIKLMVGMNNITNLSALYIFTALCLNKNIQSIEFEYNNCPRIINSQITRLISSFLHYKAKEGSLVEVNISGGFEIINQPLFPSNNQQLQIINIHVSNQIQKNDDLLINLCSGLKDNQNIEQFSLDFKNNMLTDKGIISLSQILQGSSSKLKELKLSLSGVQEGSNASLGLPELGRILSLMENLEKLEIALNEFQMQSEAFGQFLTYLKMKKGKPFNWFMISYLDNPEINLKDEYIIGEINSKFYLLYSKNFDIINNNEIILKNIFRSQEESFNISYETIKQIGNSVANYPNCNSLQLKYFYQDGRRNIDTLLKYIHIQAACNTSSLIQNIQSNSDKWVQFYQFLLIQKLQIFTIYKQLFDVLPLSIPQVVFDLREDLDTLLLQQYSL